MTQSTVPLNTTSQISINKPIPDFKALATHGQTVQLSALQGKPVILYFYPKDNTPGCTLEGENFRDHYEAFKNKNAVIFGISRDSLESHEKFKSKYQLPYELIADTDEQLCQLFDVLKLKNMYGKEVVGIERSSFLIDQTGVLRKEWRKVKVEGHVEEILEALNHL